MIRLYVADAVIATRTWNMFYVSQPNVLYTCCLPTEVEYHAACV